MEKRAITYTYEYGDCTITSMLFEIFSPLRRSSASGPLHSKKFQKKNAEAKQCICPQMALFCGFLEHFANITITQVLNIIHIK